MRFYRLFVLVLCATTIGCGNSSGGGDDSSLPTENRAPEKVKSIIYPTNNLLCIDNTLNFEWSPSSDPDGDNIKYLLEIATDNEFLTKVHTSNNNGTNKTVTLDKGKAYYWRVKATDTDNLSSDFSNINQFYTEGVGIVNHIPFAPELIEPLINKFINTTAVDLKWNANDVDGDDLTFDVYLDTQNPPTNKVGDNLTDKTLNTAVSSATNYYWKVVVKDNNGGQAIGQVWSFSVN